MKCPHCDSRAFIRSSEKLSNNVYKKYYVCRNKECSYSFVAMCEILHDIRPSLKPNQEVKIAPPIRAVSKKKGNPLAGYLFKTFKAAEIQQRHITDFSTFLPNYCNNGVRK